MPGYSNKWLIIGSLLVGTLFFVRPMISDISAENALKQTVTTVSTPEIMVVDSVGVLVIVLSLDGNVLEPQLGTALWDNGDSYVLTTIGSVVVYPKSKVVSMTVICVSHLEKYKMDKKKKHNIIVALNKARKYK